jgi:chromosomal replication initiation ATPase DnaA
MSWEDCAARYTTAEEIVAGYTAAFRAKLAKPLVGILIPKRSTDVKAPVEKSPLTCENREKVEANQKALGSLQKTYGKIRLRRAARLICAVNKVEPSDVFSRGRKRECIPARRMLICLLRRRGLSLAAIGRLIHRDHTTVLYQLRWVEAHGSYR